MVGVVKMFFSSPYAFVAAARDRLNNVLILKSQVAPTRRQGPHHGRAKFSHILKLYWLISWIGTFVRRNWTYLTCWNWKIAHAGIVFFFLRAFQPGMRICRARSGFGRPAGRWVGGWLAGWLAIALASFAGRGYDVRSVVRPVGLSTEWQIHSW